ncbi:hypothetical protein WMF31_06005 [Sorangium sp. So ce1036]|uniref:hypothetical protein n=1 Tax=Sorangium sp. So ce1036 TaxID=3133328 RepID=UPI003F08F675
MIVLDLRDLSAFSSATRALLTTCSEAASVMLWKFHTPPQGHGSWQHGGGASLEDPIEVVVLWDAPPTEVLQSHGNEKDATEYGAYAVAIALADHLGFKVLGRTHQGSGTDWLMIRKGEPANDYYKLEVSGISRINTQKPEARLAEKTTQGRRGDWKRPGLAVVARFEDLRVLSEGWA